MPCMCGDPACSSCGPAQGYNLEYEAAYEALYDEMAKAAPGVSEDILEAVTELAMSKLQSEETARERGYFECVDRIKRLYQTRERTVHSIRGTRTVTDNPVYTDPAVVQILKNVVELLEE